MKVDGVYYYCGVECRNANDAYSMFRKDYNKAQGRNSFGFLQRLGQRKERVHDSGIVFSEDKDFSVFVAGKVECYQLGLVSGSYTKIVGVPDILTEDEAYEWADVIFRKGSNLLKIAGRKQKTGRTSTGRKRIKR
jgi:hypothetical protein